MRIVLALTQRQPFSTVLWHPVTVGLTLVGQLAGIVDHVIGRAPRWRGRVVEPPGAVRAARRHVAADRRSAGLIDRRYAPAPDPRVDGLARRPGDGPDVRVVTGTRLSATMVVR